MQDQYRLVTNYVNENGIVRNHINSFNYFVDQSIYKIVRNHSTPDIPNPYFQVIFEKVRVAQPSLPNEKDRIITPHECRLRNLTYEGRVIATVRVKQLDTYRDEVEEVTIGYIPIMLQSKKCILYHCTREQFIQFHEDYYDPGGYFIINGTERVVLMYEQTVANRIIVTKDDKTGIVGASVVSDTHERKSKCELIVKDKRLILKNVMFGTKGCNLVIVMRAMGAETDQEIMQLIGSDSLFYEYLQQSLFECQQSGIFTYKQALACIAQMNPKKYNRKTSLLMETYQQLANYLLCHIPCIYLVKTFSNTAFQQESSQTQQISSKFTIQQEKPKQAEQHSQPYTAFNFHQKLIFLSEMARRVILTAANIYQATDRDFYASKRVELCDVLFSLIFEDAFRNLYTQLIKKISLKKQLLARDIFSLLSSERITSAFKQALSTGNVALDRFKYTRIGASQVISRLSYISALGQMTRLNSSFNKDLKATGPRMLNASQYGICCPSDTPEGESVGLVKNLAALAEISTYQDPQIVKNALFALGVEDLSLTDFGADRLLYQIYLNGVIQGVHSDPEFLVAQLRCLRQNNKFSPMTSVCFDKKARQVQVCCDAGRPCRPLLVIGRDNHLLLTQNDIYMIKNREIAVKDLVIQGKIEILDVAEIANCIVGYDVDDLQHMRCTHLEMHSLAVFGVVAAMVPFPHHNQSPRNVFQCAMGKQAIGIPCLNIRSRFDTLLLQLSYPQAPLTTTKFLNYATHYMQMPAGQNAVVCITSFSGYDIEDAIILNRASVDRGFGRCDVYKEQETDITSEQKIVGLPTGMEAELQQNRYIHTPERYADCYTPIYQSDSFKQTGEFFKYPEKQRLYLKFQKFHALDNDGLPILNKLVEDGDILVNKVSKDGQEQLLYRTQKDSHAAVDRVMISNTPSLNQSQMTIKVMTREHRLPYYGDKFSSRHGQKGTVGLIVNQSDMPFSPITGLVPDIIMNPHGFPSRMTMGKQLELLSGKASALRGKYADGTIFKDCRLDEVCKDLLDRGFNYTGKDVLINGLTGEVCSSYVFEGLIYYQRLKHMVNDKMHARSQGPLSFLTRQPLEGRAKDGGLRLGEMEKDCFIAYGTSYLLNERMIKASDEYCAAICPKCGVLGQFGWCQGCQSGEMRVVKMPYAAKLLTQELMAMGILMRFKID